MAWFTLIVGGLILVLGLLGQFFGIKRRDRTNTEDRRVGKIVLTIGSTVVGLWLVFFSVAHLLRLHSVGRW
ncbi:MAG TPA: hypothetical protein VFW25_04690 [Silvibacterium sp.]|nr:hypothetical protein [Silvibacterium sp.]